MREINQNIVIQPPTVEDNLQIIPFEAVYNTGQTVDFIYFYWSYKDHFILKKTSSFITTFVSPKTFGDK